MKNFNILENVLTAKIAYEQFCMISLIGELVPGICRITKEKLNRLTQANCVVYRKEGIDGNGNIAKNTGISTVRTYSVYYDENNEFYIEVTRLYVDGIFRLYLKDFK